MEVHQTSTYCLTNLLTGNSEAELSSEVLLCFIAPDEASELRYALYPVGEQLIKLY